MQGYLDVLEDARWSQQWFVLETIKLSLHAARPDEEPRYDDDGNLLPPLTVGRVVAVLDESCSTGAEVEETPGGWVFRVHSTSSAGEATVTTLRTDDEADAEDWVRGIEFNITDHQVMQVAAQLEAMKESHRRLSLQAGVALPPDPPRSVPDDDESFQIPSPQAPIWASHNGESEKSSPSRAKATRYWI